MYLQISVSSNEIVELLHLRLRSAFVEHLQTTNKKTFKIKIGSRPVVLTWQTGKL